MGKKTKQTECFAKHLQIVIEPINSTLISALTESANISIGLFGKKKQHSCS